MDWIFDNFQILAIVGIALASWLKARSDAKAAEREERRAREEMSEPDEEIFGPGEPWNEPQQWAPPPMPPPLVVKPRTPPPLPAVAQEAETELKRQMQLQERLRELRESKAVTSGGAAATRTRTATQQTGYTASAIPGGLGGFLRKRSEIRRAVILREVLGPPLGLR
jgi:type IV secretory pathway VirB10-like protein